RHHRHFAVAKDGAFVDSRRHQVHAGAAGLVAVGEHGGVHAVSVHAGAAVGGQQGGVDVEDTAGEGAQYGGADAPHVAGAHHGVRTGVAQGGFSGFVGVVSAAVGLCDDEAYIHAIVQATVKDGRVAVVGDEH